MPFFPLNLISQPEMYQVDEAKQNWEAGWSVKQQCWELSVDVG